MSITPKNWKSFQHYKDRSPAWIKLHKGLMTDFAFNRLPLASRALAPMLWLLASEYEGGEITASQEEIAFRLHVSISELGDALNPLVDSGFFHTSEPLAERKQPAIPEKRREREYREEIEEEATASAAPLDPTIPNREYFMRGREVLGSKSGGLLGKLLKAKGGNVALARAAIEQASQKANPTEYVAACCLDRSSKTLTPYQQEIQETRSIIDGLKAYSQGGDRRGGEDTRLLSYDHS